MDLHGGVAVAQEQSLSAPPLNIPPLLQEPPVIPTPPTAPPPAAINGLPPQTPAGTSPTIHENPETERDRGPRRWLGRLGEWLAGSSAWAWFSSAIVHCVAMIVLSLVLLAAPSQEPLWVMGGFDDLPVAEEVDVDLSEIPVEGPEPSLGPIAEGSDVSLPGHRSDSVGGTASPAAAGSYSLASDLANEALAPTGRIAAGALESLSNPLATRGGGLEGRTFENRRAAALAGGGTVESEAAVERALAWLAEHQWPDGGWRFDLEKCPSCSGYCRNAGKHTSSTAATGLALLSFLGAGYTHQQGKYQKVVADGLYFLQERQTITTHGGDLRDKSADLEIDVPVGQLVAGLNPSLGRRDSMYSHGIASLALTEAYAMTRDRSLREPAEQAVKFVISAQYQDGGWRYDPNFETPTRGDMTVSGWQIAVLKSANLAGIDVPYEIWMKINDFLDGIQDDAGATYLYLPGERGTAATTAIGLLCRMVCGWPREHEPLLRGVAKLGGQRPDRNNMYFNYYASQVLRHVGGPQWEKWNPKMRDYLVESQATDGHEAGSWYFAESHSTPGGRLYTTAMATMTLEVYYRYMPLYKESFVRGP